MANTQKRACAGTVVALSALLATSLATAQQKGEEASSACELTIEGRFIEKLVLLKENDRIEIDYPEARLSLPAGRYRLASVDLLGGYSCRSSSDWFTLTPNRPHHLEVGGPLTPNVRATRCGRFLRVDYYLHGVGGRRYDFDRSNSKRPHLTVFKGDAEIGSAPFAFHLNADLCSSWKVPLTAGSSQLELVVSHELGDWGTGERVFVFVDWRWYHGVPSLTLWMLIGFLLVAPKKNRHWQAWLILIPLVLLVALRLASWQAIAMLPDVPSFAAELLFFPFTSLAMAWIIVWLIGHWLSRLHGIAALLLALAVMLAAGGASYVGHFGTAHRTLLHDPDAPSMVVLYAIYAICVAVLLLAMTLSAYCCRKKYRPRRFMLWLLVWTILASMAGACVFACIAATGLLALLDVWKVPMAMPVASLIDGSIVGGILYLINLPVMVLAFSCPCYRDRFHETFRLQVPVRDRPAREIKQPRKEMAEPERADARQLEERLGQLIEQCTAEEREQVLLAAYYVAFADRRFWEEKPLLDRIGQQLDVPAKAARRLKLQALNRRPALTVPDSQAARQLAYHYALGIAACDGKLIGREREIAEMLGAHLGLSRREIDAELDAAVAAEEPKRRRRRRSRRRSPEVTKPDNYAAMLAGLVGRES